MLPTSEILYAPAAGSLSASGSIFVATDGTRTSDGAIRVGRSLARRCGIPVDLVSVVEPMTLYTPDGIPLPDEGSRLADSARDARENALLVQRDRTHPAIHDWPFAIVVGPRAETIVAEARRRHAGLILLGLGAHGIGARLAARETALRVIHGSPIPVLALPSDAWGVPHSALVAVDFTSSSEHAAHAALDLLAGEGTLYLAHVSSRVPIPQGDPRPWAEISQTGVLPRLDALARRLAPPPGVRVEHVLLHGDPTGELLAFAEEHDVDLIAAGTHGRSPLGRFVMGSVSTALVRSARCWVLVAPASAPAARNDTPVTVHLPNAEA